MEEKDINRDIEKFRAEHNVEELVKALSYQEYDVRQAAASALGELGDRQAVEPLIATLSDDDDDDVCVAAAEALGKIGDERAVAPLIENLNLLYLTKKRPSRSKEAEKGAELGAKLSVAAANALVNIGGPAIQPLFNTLSASSGRTSRREGAAMTLGMIGGSEVIDALMTIIEVSDDFGVNRAARGVLCDIGDERIVDRLIALLESQGAKDGKDRPKRISAIEVLGCIKDVRAVEPLIAALGEGDRYIAEAAAKALGEIGDLQAAEPLVVALGREKAVYDNASEALTKMGPPVMYTIIAGLKHPDDYVRGNVAMFLSRIGDERAVDPLRSALNDKDGRVRMLAEKALKSIQDRIK